MRAISYVTLTAIAVLSAGALRADPPARDIGAKRHPNLAAAQRLSHQAWEKIAAAQAANEWDLGGHAQKAKELLDQVNNELKLAAETSNRDH